MGVQQFDTEIWVADALATRYKQLCVAATRVYLSLMIVAVDFIASAYLSFDCGTDIIRWRTYFVIHALITILQSVCSIAYLTASKQMNNEHILRGSCHEAKGKPTQAREEIELGTAQARRATTVKEYMSCAFYFLHILTFVWSNLGVVTFFHSLRGECQNPRWCFVGVFVGTIMYYYVAAKWQPMEDNLERKSLHASIPDEPQSKP